MAEDTKNETETATVDSVAPSLDGAEFPATPATGFGAPQDTGDANPVLAGAEDKDAAKKDIEAQVTGEEPVAPLGKSDKPSDSDASTSDGSEKPDLAAAEPSAVSAPSASSESAPEAPASSESAEAQPELAEPHPEAQAAVQAAPEPMDELKAAANMVSPALAKLGDFEKAIESLEDEAKNRFAFARQKATEFVASLEAIFKRS